MVVIIIPLGGIGDRFKKNGYTKPKALINIFGKPIIFYLLDNIESSSMKIDFVLIPYNKEYEKYRFEDLLKKNYPNINFKFIVLQKNTEGAAETVNIALKTIEIDIPVLCLDGDNFYNIDIIKIWNKSNKIITFEDNNDNAIYSYIKLSPNNTVDDIIEKEKISNIACCGAYGFSSSKELLKYTNKIINENIRNKNEYYISTAICEMINDGVIFQNKNIDIENWQCLGTPIHLLKYYNNFPKYSCIDGKQKIKPMRICFDLDNTLVTYPRIKDDYTTVDIIDKNVEYLRYLKKFGHTIIIYTARRMKTHNGNVGKLMCDIGKITFDTLEKFDIPYDEIYFGKPYADVYIDDLAVNCFDDMEKIIGFYTDKIETRSHNNILSSTIDCYDKFSDDLSGEIYYYNNIPKELKDLFPIMLDYDVENKWYKVEKIKGVSVTVLYLSELLTSETLKHIMNSIHRIHNHKSISIDKNLNIYENYCSKLKSRYENYNYSIYNGSDVLYEKIYKKLEEYELHNRGKLSIIHGDTVMTNIMINHFDKIKFFDMRGRIGKINTIYGDSMYDWAKLYQSLIGYDKVLIDKQLSDSYEKKMIKTFEEYFEELNTGLNLEDLKWVTKSLLFSLIPLHNNDKCKKYYELIDNI